MPASLFDPRGLFSYQTCSLGIGKVLRISDLTSVDTSLGSSGHQKLDLLMLNTFSPLSLHCSPWWIPSWMVLCGLVVGHWGVLSPVVTFQELLIVAGLRICDDTSIMWYAARQFMDDPKDCFHGLHLMTFTFEGPRQELQACIRYFPWSPACLTWAGSERTR